MAREVGPEQFVEAQGLGGVREGRHEPGQRAVVEDGGSGGGHLAQVRHPAGRGAAAQGQAGDAGRYPVLLEAPAVPVLQVLVGGLEGAQDAAGKG